MTVGIITIVLGGFIALMNWLAPIQSKLKNRHVSMVPIFGALLIGIGIYSITDSFLWSLLAIPLDLGTLMFVLSLPWLFNEIWETSRFNELSKFYTNDNGRKIFITLYKKGLVCIYQEYNDTANPQEQGYIPVSQGFTGKWELIDNKFYITEFLGGRKLELIINGDSFLSIESNVEPNAEKHTLMDDLIFNQTKNLLKE